MIAARAPKTSARELLALKSDEAPPVFVALVDPPVGLPWKLAPVVFDVVLDAIFVFFVVLWW